jgi:hypothetical protein
MPHFPRFATVCAASLIAFALSATPVAALDVAPVTTASPLGEQHISLSVSPTRQSLELNPNETTTGNITVTNSGTLDYRVRVYATPFTVNEDYSQNVFDQENNYSQISRWITFAGATEFDLAANERKTVDFEISVPESVPAGGQYASIMAETVPDENATGVVAVRRIASLLYAHVTGTTINKGNVISREWSGIYTTSEIKTRLTVENSGNTDFTVISRLIITDLFGHKIDEISTPVRTLLPDTTLAFDLNWTSPSLIGIYHLAQETDLLDDTIRAEHTIIIMPIWFAVLALLLVIGIIFTLVIFIKKRHKK